VLVDLKDVLTVGLLVAWMVQKMVGKMEFLLVLL